MATQTPTREIARSGEIAARDGLRALRGSTRDGQTVYAVLNRSATRAAGYPVYHLLLVDRAAGRIRCDCPAQVYGRVCAHAAAVRALLQAERDERREHSAPAPRPAFSMWR